VAVLLSAAAVWLAGCVVDLRSQVSAYAAQSSRGRRLQVRLERSYQRILAKQEVLAVLARGRLTLRDAAAHFRELDRADPNFRWEQFSRVHPGNTDEERHCHEVMVQVREQQPDNPGLAAVLPRLEDELRELVRGNTGDGRSPRSRPSQVLQ
jgi:hypothetical protein